MIISKENVKVAVTEMAEGVSPSDAVVRAACERMGALIKPELTEDEISRFYGNVLYGAALMALRDTLAADNSPTEIKAGDVSIKNSSQIDKLTEMLKETVAFLTPVLAADKTTFSAVEWRRKP